MIDPAYAPCVSPAGLTLTERVSGVVPPVEFTFNQPEEFGVTENETGAEPEALVIVIGCAAGATPTCVVNDNEVLSDVTFPPDPVGTL